MLKFAYRRVRCRMRHGQVCPHASYYHRGRSVRPERDRMPPPSDNPRGGAHRADTR